ncbi:MAG: carboxypeptidase M32 [Chloroflexia bacterium]|nr:carboxypeptidase M32 [Chloroflexia bacterium]
MNENMQLLRERLQEIRDLNAAAGLLYWDQTTYMPPAASPARARQMATLRRISHQKSVDPELGRLLDELDPYAEGLPPGSDDAALVRLARRDYERATRVPSDFVARFAQHRAETFEAWTRARPADDFALVQPYLEKTVQYSREMAGFFPGYEHIADPLIDFSDYGIKVSILRPLFAELRQGLRPLLQAIAKKPPIDDACLRQTYPVEQQLAFVRELVQHLGYDMQRGRIDLVPHPYTTMFSIYDVRLTTRASAELLNEALFGTIHEAGHSLYDQGIDPAFEGTPLARGASSGVHESQSRLWENVVGRSRAFWTFFYPRLQQVFPDQLANVPLETFYRAANKVQPGLIRVNADELTYNMHIIIRFELELDLLEGRLAVADLPEAWRERYRRDLGVVPPDDRDGVMQDMHWYYGSVGGGFQGYTIGNILSAQFFNAAVRAEDEIPADIERGEFGRLLGWLQENVYRHGRKFDPVELVERATGRPLQLDDYMDYLWKKYGELYGLEK